MPIPKKKGSGGAWRAYVRSMSFGGARSDLRALARLYRTLSDDEKRRYQAMSEIARLRVERARQLGVRLSGSVFGVTGLRTAQARRSRVHQIRETSS